jgi:hypothetical protein
MISKPTVSGILLTQNNIHAFSNNMRYGVMMKVLHNGILKTYDVMTGNIVQIL